MTYDNLPTSRHEDQFTKVFGHLCFLGTVPLFQSFFHFTKKSFVWFFTCFQLEKKRIFPIINDSTFEVFSALREFYGFSKTPEFINQTPRFLSNNWGTNLKFGSIKKFFLSGISIPYMARNCAQSATKTTCIVHQT